MRGDQRLCAWVFITDLGWIALAGRGSTVVQVTFARGSQAAALAALDPAIRAVVQPLDWNPTLVRRLEEFAGGAPHDFRDVNLDLDHLTPFQRRIVKACRAIGYAQTASYGEVAAAAGSARAARAVGNTMAANRFALVVPCHRVVHSAGQAGVRTSAAKFRAKLRLLEKNGRTRSPGRGSPKTGSRRTGSRRAR